MQNDQYIASDALDKKNVGIVGWWYAKNYGARLTTLALYKLIEHMGWTPTMISIARAGIDRENRFMKKLGIRYTQEISKASDFEDLNNQFSTFVVGSDQLWRYHLIYQQGRHAYFLDFVKPGRKRIAYGTSLGTNPCMAPDDFREEAAFNLSFFDGVSSREREGVEVLKKQYKTDASFVLDPVFMCSADQYREWASLSSRILPDGDYVCSYIMDKDADGAMASLIKHVSVRENASMINMLNVALFDEIKKTISLPGIVENLETEDWLLYIANCKHLITDSFHGMCFALIFNKPFTVVGNEARGNARFTSMLAELGMKDYLLNGTADITRVEQLPPINWNQVNAALDSLRGDSAKWLQKQLEKPLPSPHNDALYLYSEIRKIRGGISLVTKQSKLSLPVSLNDLALLYSYDSIKSKYCRYAILSKIAFGPKRVKYEQKTYVYKQLMNRVREIRKNIESLINV